MKPMISITGHISSFYELMNTSQHFVESHGVDAVTARKFVTSFYSSLAQGSERSSESLEDLAEEAGNCASSAEVAQPQRFLRVPLAAHWASCPLPVLQGQL